MPLYEFQCKSCSKMTERLFTSFNAMVQRGALPCACGSTMERLASAPAFKVAASIQSRTDMRNGMKVTTTIRGNETIDDYV